MKKVRGSGTGQGEAQDEAHPLGIAAGKGLPEDQPIAIELSLYVMSICERRAAGHAPRPPSGAAYEREFAAAAAARITS